jgi:hypothetical protein
MRVPHRTQLQQFYAKAGILVRSLLHFSDMRLLMSTQAFSIPAAIRDRISAPAQPRVWTPEDFADLGPRTAVDQALHRLVASRNLRRIARGFYDTLQDNRLTGKPTYPNPRDVIDALARKGKVRVVVDGLTAPNDLGLTDAVPARIGVLTDGRLRPITLGNLTLDFQAAAPSRLYWAGRPAMRFVQALHWLRDMLPSDDGSLRKRLVSILKDKAGRQRKMQRWPRIVCAVRGCSSTGPILTLPSPFPAASL